jgi:ABC-type uncharacterized transport system ATPase subunit
VPRDARGLWNRHDAVRLTRRHLRAGARPCLQELSGREGQRGHFSLGVRPGEIHALLGENGAGKSTLVKMIYGIMQPDAGRSAGNGKPVEIASPKAARKLGIGMVFQHFSLFDGDDGAREHRARARRDRAGGGARRRASGDDRQLRPAARPDREVHTLSVGERQRIEIVRALLLEPKLLIMDEPTSVLTPQEVEQLFVVLRQLASARAARSSTFRTSCTRSKRSATRRRSCAAARSSRPAIRAARRRARMAEKMIGGGAARASSGAAGRQLRRGASGVEGLSMPGEAGPFGTILQDISFEARAGEILGIAGVAGNGQNELLLALGRGRRAMPTPSRSTASRSAGSDPGARRRLGLGQRARGAQRPRRGAGFLARRQRRADGARPLAPCRAA